MYLTAQRVRSRAGAEEVHAFLHLHDQLGFPFPTSDPLSVPERNPGRLVRRSPPEPAVPSGGNSVIAYLDIIAEDRLCTTRYQDGIDAVAELAVASGKPLPWVAEVGPVRVIFNANVGVPVVSEYQDLLGAAWPCGRRTKRRPHLPADPSRRSSGSVGRCSAIG